MESAKKQITARIPEVIYLGGIKKAEAEGLTFTDVLVEALERYLGDELPGLCPLCHIQNNPEAQYCQGCGTALNPDAQGRQMETLNNVIETLKQLDKRMSVLEKKVSKR
jgi:predicted amidophosphoribosyltransferase